MFLRRKEAGHPTLPSLIFSCSVHSPRSVNNEISWAYTIYQAMFFMFHNSPLQQVLVSLWRCLSDDRGTARSSSRVHVALLAHGPCISPSGSFTHWSAPSWPVFLDSWAPRGENHLRFWYATGTQSIWRLAVSKPSFPRIREWGQERVSELPNGHSGR